MRARRKTARFGDPRCANRCRPDYRDVSRARGLAVARGVELGACIGQTMAPSRWSSAHSPIHFGESEKGVWMTTDLRLAGYLWRAVDHEGEVLDMLVQSCRDSRSALRLMRKLLRKQGFVPKLLVTNKLRSYGSAFRQLQLTCPHEQGLRQNNRAENSHQPVRRRERKMQRFKIGSISPALPQHACRGPQHLQLSTPSRLAIDAAELSNRSGERMAKSSRGRVIAYPAFRLL